MRRRASILLGSLHAILAIGGWTLFRFIGRLGRNRWSPSRRMCEIPALFVDSRLQIEYSGVLARCCARGLCRCTGPGRRGSIGPHPEAGQPAAGLVFAVQSSEPERRSPHPNRTVWKWVDLKPVRMLAGARRVALSIWFL